MVEGRRPHHDLRRQACANRGQRARSGDHGVGTQPRRVERSGHLAVADSVSIKLPGDLTDLLRDTLQHAPPDVQALGSGLIAGQATSEEQIGELIDFLNDELLARGRESGDGLNALGLGIEALIDRLYQAQPSFWKPPESS